MTSADSARTKALADAVTEIERHAAEGGWDAPVSVYSLVRTADLLTANPQLADEVPGGAAEDPQHLTSIAQEGLPEADELEDSWRSWRGRILWTAQRWWSSGSCCRRRPRSRCPPMSRQPWSTRRTIPSVTTCGSRWACCAPGSPGVHCGPSRTTVPMPWAEGRRRYPAWSRPSPLPSSRSRRF